MNDTMMKPGSSCGEHHTDRNNGSASDGGLQHYQEAKRGDTKKEF
jgi:hypothetical protein